jgi:hypothetical protein
MEKIIAIMEHEKDGYEGYKVITSEQEILLSIDNDQACCEDWGYFWCNEKPQSFVGTNLKGIEITDTELNKAIMLKNEVEQSTEYFEGGVMFVNLNTSGGVLQFVAYNQHNGYYGHSAIVTSKQLNHEECL